MKRLFNRLINFFDPNTPKRLIRKINRLKRFAKEEGCYTPDLVQFEKEIDNTFDEDLKIKLQIKFKKKLTHIVDTSIINDQYDRAW